MRSETIESDMLWDNGGEYVKCVHCNEITHCGGLIGEETNDCPRCGQNAFVKNHHWELLASSSTLEGILQSITRFYCGEPKQIQGELVIGSKGPLDGVRVICKKGRYRFEMAL